MPCWVFQAKEQYDLSSALRERSLEEWELRQHASAVRPGDIVYFWQAGESAALWGWGSVTRVVQSPNGPVAQATCIARFAKPITRGDLAHAAQAFRGQQGSILRLSDDEATQVDHVIRASGYAAPPDPRSDEVHMRSGHEFLGSRSSPTLMQVFETAVTTARGQDRAVSDVMVLSAMLQVGHKQEGLRTAAAWLIGRVRPHAAEDIWLDAFGPSEGEQPIGREMPSGALLDASATAVLRRAHQVREQVSDADSGLAARHVVVAMLMLAEEGAAQRLADALARAGADPQSLCGNLLELLRNDGPTQERERWGELSRSRRPVPPRVCISRFCADAPDGNDCLDFTGDVNAMANLIASRLLQPPLAVGLFGHWGSGKTYFMNGLREAVGALAAKARETQSQHAYWPNIVPIEFNAWHYMDANLWASLVAHIFGTLKEWSAGGSDGAQRNRREALRQLKIAEEAQADARRRLIQAQHTLEQAEAAKTARLKQLEQDQRELAAALAKDVWGQVAQSVQERLPTLKAQFQELGVQVDTACDSARQLYRQLQELRTVGGRVRAVFASMASWRHLCGAGAVVVLMMLILLLAALWANWQWPELSMGLVIASAGQATTLLAGVATWVAASLKRVSTAIAPLEQLRGRMAETLEEAENEKAKERVALEGRLAQVRGAYREAVAEAEIAKRTYDAARAELDEEPSASLIARFIEQRAASGEYRKHLGIVATIREDFAELSRRIQRHNGAWPAASEATAAVAQGGERELGPRQDGDLGINRIVLYIDDLDRCPADRVVEVLQAVHLLLAFPLFVVVLAVDARWVSRSLQEQYRGMLFAHGNGTATGANGEASTGIVHAPPRVGLVSPRDYLEKIFQVPYWIRPMAPEGCRRLIGEMVRADLASEGDQAQRHMESAPANATTPKAAVDQQHAGIVEDSSGPGIVTGEQRAAGERQLSPLPETPLMRPEALRLEPTEIAAMKSLAPIIGHSPRAAKRFLNTYRLIKAALPPHKLRVFAGPFSEQPQFRAPMLLLALATGMPGVASAILSGCSQAGHDGGGGDLASLIKGAISKDACSDEERSALRRFVDSEANREWTDLPSEVLAEWAPRIGQFCFETLIVPRS